MNRRSNGLPQQPKLQTLRKIMPNDRFPCFICFDNPHDKLKCTECGGNGYIHGSHPMVQFAEDFIEKRLSGMVSNQMMNGSQQSGFGEIIAKMSGSYDPHKKSQEVFPSTSSKTVAIGDHIRESFNRQIDEPLAQQYFCNECPNQDQAIKGKRYHCMECEDYDLCQNCFNKGFHEVHKLQQMKPIRKPDNQTVVRQIKDGLIKKSIRYKK